MQKSIMSWRRSLAIGFGLALALSSAPLSADVWDNDPGNQDDGYNTDNELFHGAVQDHDLAAQGGVVDQDWYAVRSRPYSSYEVLVDSMQGEVYDGTPVFDRVDDLGNVLTAGYAPWGGTSSIGVRWQNNTGAEVGDYVRITGANTSCTTTCTTNARYTIRMWETTGSMVRFNNAGSQVTVVQIQNPAGYWIDGTIFLWSAAGTLVASQTFVLPPKQLFVLNTASLAPGVGGSVTVTHGGRFGDLQGKAVALEPTTGFSFDSPMTYRPH